MDEKRYFYTPDGTEVFGPVDLENLRQLGRSGVLHSGSFICLEGETEWQPFSPAAFSKPSPAPPPSSRPLRAPARQTVVINEESGEKGWLPLILNLVTVYAALRGLIHYMVRLPRWVQTDDPNQRTLTQLAIGVFVLVILPWWFSLLFKGFRRVIVRTVGIVILAVAMEVIYFMPQTPEEVLAAQEQAIQEKVTKDARQELAATGNLKGTGEKAQAALQQMSALATGDSETARETRVVAAVANEFAAKVKISEEAFADCNFDVTTITGKDDIAQRRAKLVKYRQTQADVLEDAKTLMSRMKDAMVTAKVSPDKIDQDIADASASNHYDLMISGWQNRVKVVDDQIAQLDFLNQTYGAWNVTDGQIIFHDQASLNSYNALIQTLQDDAKAVNDAAKRTIH